MNFQAPLTYESPDLKNAEQSSAAIRINADLSNGSKQLLLLLNPHLENSTIPLDQKLEKDWKTIATIDRFNFSGIDEAIEQDLSTKSTYRHSVYFFASDLLGMVDQL